MAAPVIFDGRAGRFRWPRRSFSMAAPVGFDGRAGRQLCPYEAQYVNEIDGDADSRKRKEGLACVTDLMLCICVAAFLCNFWILIIFSRRFAFATPRFLDLVRYAATRKRDGSNGLPYLTIIKYIIGERNIIGVHSMMHLLIHAKPPYNGTK